MPSELAALMCLGVLGLPTSKAIVLKPVNEESLKRLQDMLKGKGMLKSLTEERHKDADRK